MAGSVIHLLVASPGVDSKQFIHQLYDAHRSGILLVELDRVDKLPPRVAPTGRMHHLRPAHTTVVSRIAVCLENPLELVQEARWTFALAAHAEIEDRRAARRAVLPQVG